MGYEQTTTALAVPTMLPPDIHLYELTEAWRVAMAAMYEIDPNLPDAEARMEQIGYELQALGGAIEAKVDSALAVYSEFKRTSEALAEEIARLRDRQEQYDKRAARIKEYVFRELKHSGLTRVDGARFSAAIRQNPEAVQVVDLGAIPSEFIRTKIVQEIDKSAIKAAHKAGAEVPGVRFTRGERLDIR